jgi:hypothetical protein
MAAAVRLVKGDIGSRIDEEAEAALAAFGLIHEGAAPEASIDVWPENFEAVRLFIAMGTQWNVGMSGAIGLRYEALPAVMRLSGIPSAERRAAFDGLRIMERAALDAMRNG